MISVYIYMHDYICIIVNPHVCGITGSILKRWCWNSWRKSRASSFAMICSQLWPVSQVETYEACRENIGNNLTKSDYPMLIKGGLLSHTAIFSRIFPWIFWGICHLWLPGSLRSEEPLRRGWWACNGAWTRSKSASLCESRGWGTRFFSASERPESGNDSTRPGKHTKSYWTWP